jgi:hypothetical protein
MISVIFELLIKDLNACALNLVSLPEIGAMRGAIDRLVATPRTTREAWEFVANHSRETK